MRKLWFAGILAVLLCLCGCVPPKDSSPGEGVLPDIISTQPSASEAAQEASLEPTQEQASQPAATEALQPAATEAATEAPTTQFVQVPTQSSTETTEGWTDWAGGVETPPDIFD